MAKPVKVEEKRKDPCPDYEKNLAQTVNKLVEFELTCLKSQENIGREEKDAVPVSPTGVEASQQREVSAGRGVDNQLPDSNNGQNQSHQDGNFIGYMLVFNQWKFAKKNGIDERKHTHIDMINLEKAWTTLGYKVKFFINLTSHEILETIGEYVYHDLTKYGSSFGVTFMSHGQENFRISTWDEKKWSIKEATSKIAFHPNVKSKPKIICIQACRGLIKMRDVAARVRDETLPEDADFLYFSSTTESHPAHRSQGRSWFISGISTVVDQMKPGETIEFEAFCRRVRKFMVQYKADNPDDDSIHDGRQIAESKSTLLEEFNLTKSTFPISPTKLTLKMMFNRVFEEKRVQQEGEMKKQAEEGRNLAVPRRNQKAKKQDAEKTFLKKCKTFVSKVWH